jgi:hypothetical protein
MDSAAKEDITQLRLYLNSISISIRVPELGQSKYNFQHFAPDPEWVEDIGEEGSVNRELEIRLGSRKTGSMEETLLGKRKRDGKTVPDPRNLSDKHEAEDDINCDGLGDLDEPPLDLAGINGTAFAIPQDFDIQSLGHIS